MAVQGFDTNVIVRLLVRDDKEQCRRAELAFRKAIASGGVWLLSVVLVEVSWVLRVAYTIQAQRARPNVFELVHYPRKVLLVEQLVRP